MLIRKIKRESCSATEHPDASGVSMQVLIGADDGAPNFALRHIVVEAGGHTPLHSHDYEHELVILSGAGLVVSGQQEARVEAGDVLLIQPNIYHQIRATGQEAIQILCLVPTVFISKGHRFPTPGSTRSEMGDGDVLDNRVAARRHC